MEADRVREAGKPGTAYGMEGLLEALQEGEATTVMRLLDAEPALLERAIHEGDRPLAVAAKDGQLGLVRLLVHRKANVNASGPLGRTALHWAADRGNEEMVAFLLSEGAHADIADSNGGTPAMLASLRGHVGVVQLLAQYMGTQGLDEGDDMGTQGVDEGDEAGWTALCFAAHRGSHEVVRLLLSKGARAHLVDVHGRTPIMLASTRNHWNVVEVLSRHLKGLGLDVRDLVGKTALHYAAERGHWEVIEELLVHGADHTIRDGEGNTPRDLALGGQEQSSLAAVFDVSPTPVLSSYSGMSRSADGSTFSNVH